MKRLWKLGTRLQGKVQIMNIPQGHHDHQSGSGMHLDKRTKRKRDRSASVRYSIHDQLS